MAKSSDMAKKYPDMFASDTNQDPRQRKRVRPMEVLNLGFPRTGTASIQQALNILGIPCWHGYHLFSNIRDAEMWSAALDAKYFDKGEEFQKADWDQLLGNFAAASDVPVICFAKELIEAYPEAKVILVERNLEDWYRSFDKAVVMATWNPLVMFFSKYDKRYLGPLKDMTHRWINGYMHAFTANQMRQNARTIYLEHYSFVRQITPKHQLLEYKLGSGWEPLCSFLEKPIPDVPFPKTNDMVALHEKVGIAVRKSVGNVLGRKAISVFVLVSFCLWIGVVWSVLEMD